MISSSAGCPTENPIAWSSLFRATPNSNNHLQQSTCSELTGQNDDNGSTVFEAVRRASPSTAHPANGDRPGSSNPDSQGPGPVAFNPKKIKHIGTAGERDGTPSITFSNSDAEFLTDRLGHAIVGKFSHSIPSSHHIQKALGNVKFAGPFSWKHINAKHVLIQFRELADYARLLSGPNGAPVWYVDRHPMRVFKWTPEFDPFFESPIAAIWCNLIGLPIHLYEPSALFAIGSLLGNPIQADHATVTQSRLSFARICVEIDISVKPKEEIVLEILGKEVRQKVVWDRFPTYCVDCKHVGHEKDTCYAFGRKAMPLRKDYTLPNSHTRGWSGPRSAAKIWRPRTNEGVETSNVFASLSRNDDGKTATRAPHNGPELTCRDHPPSPRRPFVDNEGFQLVDRRKGKRNRGRAPSGQGFVVTDGGYESRSGDDDPHDQGIGRQPFESCEEGSKLHLPRETRKPKFYRQLANGEFDTEEFEEVVDEEIDMEEIDPGGQAGEHLDSSQP